MSTSLDIIPTVLIPIFDTTLVTISRKYINRPISIGGRDHLSHRLISIGYSEKKSLLVMYSMAASGCCLSLILKYLDLSISLLIVVLLLILFIGFGAMLSRVKVYNSSDYDIIIDDNKKITLINTVLMYKRQIVELIVDSIIITYSLYFSYWLQFYGSIPESFLEVYSNLVLFILPYTILIFIIFGFYSTIWRYLTVGD